MPSNSKGKSDGSSQPSSSASSSSSSGSRPSFTRSQSGSLQLHNPLAPAARANGGANSNVAGASSPNPATKGQGKGKEQGKGKGKGKGGALSATEIKLLSGEVVDVGEFQAQEVRALKRQVAAIAKKVYEQGPGSDDSSSSAGGGGGRRGSGSIEALLRMRGSGGRRRMIDFAVQWPEFVVSKVKNGVPGCSSFMCPLLCGAMTHTFMCTHNNPSRANH